MPIFRTVEFWPSGGSPDFPWCEDAGEDAFVRSARSICELYSDGLWPAQIKARNSSLRLFCEHDARTDVLVVVFTEPSESFEMARVTLPVGVELLDGHSRAGLVLDVVHGAAVRLAEARGWDRSALEAAEAHVLEQGLRYQWVGPAKSSPDRRHTARPVYRLQDDGYGRVALEVRRRADDALVAVSEEALAFSTSEGFARSARTLRWRGSATVELVPYSGLFGDDIGLLSLSLADPAVSGDGSALPTDKDHAEKEPASGAATVPAVVVRGEGANAPEAGPQMLVGGGGPINDVPRAYLTTLHDLLDAMRTPEWLSWWSAADDDVLEVEYAFEVSKVTTYARRGNNKLRVAIQRPVQTFAAADDLVLLARRDVDAMLATIRRRTGLGPHPTLPTLAEMASLTAKAIAREDNDLHRMRSLLASLTDRLPAWLVTDLTMVLDDGTTGDFLQCLRRQLIHHKVAATKQESAELAALSSHG